MLNSLANAERVHGTDAGRNEGASKGQVVQSLTRALNLLTILGGSKGPMTLTELADAADLSPSTTHRLLTTLQIERYVRFDQATRGWSVGVQAYVTGVGFLATRNIVDIARPRMRRLMEETSEVVNLAVEENGEARYLARITGPRVAHGVVPATERTLLHCSAVGKAMLSGMTAARVQSILNERGMRQFTRSTVTSLPHLHTELQLTRSRGFAVDQEERESGLRCVAAPIFDENAGVLGALSLSASNRRMDDQRIAMLGEAVRRTSIAITREIGGRVPA